MLYRVKKVRQLFGRIVDVGEVIELQGELNPDTNADWLEYLEPVAQVQESSG